VRSEPSADSYRAWTSERHVPFLGTNDGATPVAFQEWHHFKEAFPPELIARAVESSVRPVSSCLDPFGGSGTTALACQMMGISSTTVEVNPFLADVIRAKLTRYDPDILIRDLAEVRRLSRHQSPDPATYFEHVPASFIEQPSKTRWLFNRQVAARIAAIVVAIESLEDPDSRRLCRIILGGILVEVSNVTVSGKGRRYRKNWKELKGVDGLEVDRLFSSRMEEAIVDITRFLHRPRVPSLVVNDDARVVRLKKSFDLAVFSPPYPNSFDYTDIYNIELWMLGYLSGTEDNRALRTATLSSHVQLMRKYARAPRDSPTLLSTLTSLHEARDQLWSRWIPEMVGSYFADLTRVLRRVQRRLNSAARCWVVVGDSRYAGTAIPVARIICELSTSCGWVVESCEPIRHMRSSVQQGWRQDLAESLIVMTPYQRQ
jgi:hypothetical protein